MTNLQDNELDKIILGVRNYYAGLRSSENLPIPCMTDLEAQAAIAELVEGALPEKRLKRNGEPTTNMATAEWGYNQALKEIRNNLKAKGII